MNIIKITQEIQKIGGRKKGKNYNKKMMSLVTEK